MNTKQIKHDSLAYARLIMDEDPMSRKDMEQLAAEVKVIQYRAKVQYEIENKQYGTSY